MKHRLFLLSTLLGSALMLSGCVEREEADAILISSCKSAAQHLIQAPFQLKEIKDTRFEEVAFGSDTGLKQLTLRVNESDGWMSRDKEYICVFSESHGLFNMTYKADLYRLQLGNQIYGKGEGGTSSETIDAWLDLHDAAKAGME